MTIERVESRLREQMSREWAALAESKLEDPREPIHATGANAVAKALQIVMLTRLGYLPVKR